MASKSQLQRALLDASAVLASAANIARRAAISIDPESAIARPYERPSSGVAHARTRQPSPPTVEPKAWPSHSIASQRTTGASAVHKAHVYPHISSSEPQTHIPSAFANVKLDEQRQPGASPPTTQENTDAKADEETSSVTQSSLSAETSAKKGEDESDVTHTHVPIVERASEPDVPGPQSSSDSAVQDAVYSSPVQTHAQESVASTSQGEAEEYDATKENRLSPLRSTKVPSSRIARLLHYGSLGAGLAWGAAGSYLRSGPDNGQEKQFMSDDNIRRLVDKLSTMRGAALKLGQFMSIQDSNLLPEQIEQVMLRVQNSAHYMPQWQMERVMQQDLGSDWKSWFETFDEVPFASASIGQVHAATLSNKVPSALAGQKVAVKVQFPGVRESIGSDLANLRWLVSVSALLPRGLFLDNTIRVMRRELDDECDYEREREMCKRFGELLNRPESPFAVPRVVDQLCSKRVLTCEMMKGRPLTQAARFSQEKRDTIARSILELSLRELFSFRLMQTDPNWSNFLFNEQTNKIELIDFGATREYSQEFMDDWLRLLRSAIAADREACIRWSEKIGYLTGEESEEMRNAHVDSMIALGEPFRDDAPDPYPFAGQTITERVRAQIPLMLRERLTPPPEPTYSLNRKLSGAFLLCARLKANVSCRGLFESVTKDYALRQDGQNPKAPLAGNGSPFTSSAPSGVRSFHTARIVADMPPKRFGHQRMGNLANRWPRHIVEAVKETLNDEGAGKGDDKFVTLAADPGRSSSSDKAGALPDLSAQPVGGQVVRPSDAAESPITAFDSQKDSTSVAAAKPVYIRNIAIPAKPSPPGAEDCCMSGCARCVYDLYAEDLQDYQKDLSAARAKIMSLQPPFDMSQWNENLLGPRPQEQGAAHDETGADKRTAEEKAQDEVDAVIGQLDPSMKAFLQLERKLKRKGQHPTSSQDKKQTEPAAST